MFKALRKKQTKKTNVEEMMELENNHLVTTIIITDSAKNHQWMVKLVGEGLKNNKKITSEYLLTR